MHVRTYPLIVSRRGVGVSHVFSALVEFFRLNGARNSGGGTSVRAAFLGRYSRTRGRYCGRGASFGESEVVDVEGFGLNAQPDDGVAVLLQATVTVAVPVTVVIMQREH